MDVDLNKLKQHVETLAAAPRPRGSEELKQARNYIGGEFTNSGFDVIPVSFDAEDEMGTPLSGVNLLARNARFSDDSLPRFIIGAHYDSRPDSPGADDNASAVAALLEIARLLPGFECDQPAVGIELIAFDLEEDGMLGGEAHAEAMRAHDIDIAGMVSLEMLGYRDTAPNSQALPRSLVGLYPDTGDFIAVIGNQNSEALASTFGDGMKQVEALPVETLLVPENGNQLQATRLSDHSPFWDAGFPALMITDTSFLRNPFYHTPNDTPDTLDWEFLHLVAEGCWQAMRAIVANGLS